MKNCQKCGQSFNFTDDEKQLLKKIYPVIGGRAYEIPEPNLCYHCRLQQRMAWRNDMNLYERRCDKGGKKLISMFRPDSDLVVWDKELWWQDDWDARDYGMNFDFNRSFTEQFGELIRKVPFAHVAIYSDENSLYTNYNLANKNCYLCFAGNHLENSMYCYTAEGSKDCMDCHFVYNCELCYECVQCSDCYDLKFSQNSKSCVNSWFLEDCQSCQDCFMCFNLRKKQYCILNKQYSAKEYQQRLRSFKLDTNQGVAAARRLFEVERLKQPKPENHNHMAEDCSGEYINESKNCRECYNMMAGAEDCIKILNGFPALKDALDCTYSGDNAELMYQTMASGANCARVAFCHIACVGSYNVYYSNFLSGSKNCFGCSNLRNAQYCIFNKQYLKEEYEELLPRIIDHMRETGEWGAYLDPVIAPFAYNETLAMQHFPLDKKEAIKQGFVWSDYQVPEPKAERVVNSELELPDISEISDEICGWALECRESGRLYKITTQELAFYRKHQLPIPRLSFKERHGSRIKRRNDFELSTSCCGKCEKKIETSYSPDSKLLVYCQDCYLKLVY